MADEALERPAVVTRRRRASSRGVVALARHVAAFSVRAWPVTLAVITLLGGAARFWNLNWDDGWYVFHPDERALNDVVRRLGPDLHPHFFYYGSLPIYLYRATAELLSAITGLDWLFPGRLPLVGRHYSALFSTAMLLLVFAIGRRLWGTAAGLLAATFASPPRLGPLAWPDDEAEETFQVFDHPTVRLFRNIGHLSVEELRTKLGAATAGP